MSTDQRPQFGFNEIAKPAFAVVLWHTTIYLLGLPGTMPPGATAKIGSIIVLLGCFFVADPVVGLTARFFRRKSAPPAAPRAVTGPETAAARPRTALFRRSGSRSRGTN